MEWGLGREFAFWKITYKWMRKAFSEKTRDYTMQGGRKSQWANNGVCCAVYGVLENTA
jgi:hypothetical protein